MLFKISKEIVPLYITVIIDKILKLMYHLFENPNLKVQHDINPTHGKLYLFFKCKIEPPQIF